MGNQEEREFMPAVRRYYQGLFLYSNGLTSTGINAGQVWVDCGLIYNDFHAQAVDNGLDIVRINEILSQAMKVIDVQVQHIRSIPVLCLKFPYQAINEAQHVVPLCPK